MVHVGTELNGFPHAAGQLDDQQPLQASLLLARGRDYRLPGKERASIGPVSDQDSPNFYYQLTQGQDTDSFGATAGSILGAYFGPEGLEARWLAPFNGDLRTGLARFYERSLAGVARRMRKLPKRVAEEIQK
jgi:hypothetical protein